MTILPSTLFTALYIGAGMFLQDLLSMELFFIIALLTSFPFEVWMLLSANKKLFGKVGIWIAFMNYEKMGEF